MATTIPIKVYEILEDRLGREDAKELVREIESAVEAVAIQKKVEVRDELSGDLASKSDLRAEINAVRSDLTAMEAKLERKIDAIEWKLKLYFLILLFAIIIFSPKAVDFIAKLVGVIK